MWHILKTTGCWEGEIWNRRKNGEVFPAWQSIVAVRNEHGQIAHYNATFSDISEQKFAADRIYHLAHYDLLTALPNRWFFHANCRHALERARRDETQVAVLSLDLDRFKQINDALGHPSGDELLIQVANRLKQQLREIDIIARLGGDEFAIALEKISQFSELEKVSQKILTLFKQPFSLKNHEIIMTASLGISLYPSDGDDVTRLIQNADMAMHRAKEQGGNKVQFFSSNLNPQAMNRLLLEAELHHALIRNELVLYYQPQYELKSGRFIGAEALIRWQHHKRGLIAPNDFIPIADESGLILPIGEWVLYTACQQAKHWLDCGLALECISINLSGLQIQRGNIVDLVGKILADTRLPPRYLELEILETYIMQHVERDMDTLVALRELGVKLAIDDFGTGQSSLAYLKRLPVDKLKIDRAFVMGIPNDEDDVAIITTIITLAHAMRLTVIAEGIETEAQAQFLSQLGCDQAQGFHYNPPLDVNTFTQMSQQFLRML